MTDCLAGWLTRFRHKPKHDILFWTSKPCTGMNHRLVEASHLGIAWNRWSLTTLIHTWIPIQSVSQAGKRQTISRVWVEPPSDKKGSKVSPSNAWACFCLSSSERFRHAQWLTAWLGDWQGFGINQNMTYYFEHLSRAQAWTTDWWRHHI